MPKLIETLLPKRQMQFEPVPDDDDKISQDINNDPIVNDDQWNLEEDIDPDGLYKFWKSVVKETKSDTEVEN